MERTDHEVLTTSRDEGWILESQENSMRWCSLALNPDVQPQGLLEDSVGFPGETQESFCRNCRFEKTGLGRTHPVLGCTLQGCKLCIIVAQP